MLSKWLFLFLPFMILINIFSRNAGATTVESTSRVTDDAQVHAQKELEGRTGETDSEAEDDARAAGDDNTEDA